MFSNAWLKRKWRKILFNVLLYSTNYGHTHTVFTEQNLRIYTEYLQNNFRNINNYNKRTYLQQGERKLFQGLLLERAMQETR